MTGTADLNLVLARILPQDALHARAVDHLEGTERLVVPWTVGVELLFVADRFDLLRVEAVGAMDRHFDVENLDVLYTAAEALDEGEITTVFDAVHLADALHRDVELHTADDDLLASPYPMRGF